MAKYAVAVPVLSHHLILPRAFNATAHIPSAWISGPQGRGTFDLLYSCFNTLFLCAWTAFHPNVPSKDSTKQSVFIRFGWMLVAIFLPESVLYCAWDQWWAAKDLRDEIDRLAKRGSGRIPRTSFTDYGYGACPVVAPTPRLSHQSPSTTSIAPSSGYARPSAEAVVLADLESSNPHHSVDVVRNSRQTSPNRSSDLTNRAGNQSGRSPNAVSLAATEDHCPNNQAYGIQNGFSDVRTAFASWTPEQAFFAVSGGMAIDTTSFSDRAHLTLTPNGLIFLAELGLLPRFTKQDVMIRGKADAFAKLISCTQALWFFVQGIGRVCTGLPLTLLEIHTMTHIVCALVMYGIWFRKAYGVTSPIVYSDQALVNMAALIALHGTDSAIGFCTGEYCLLEHDIGIETIRCVNKAPAESPKVYAHLDAANGALDYLRQRGAHIRAHIGGSVGAMDGLEPLPKLATKSISNWYVKGRFNNGGLLNESIYITTAAFTFSVLYGGSHLSAWASHFPTHAEMWIWRACGITMVATPLILGIMILFRFCHERLRRESKEDAPFWGVGKGVRLCFWIIFWSAWKISHAVLRVLLVYAYPLARLYLFVESLASLRSPVNGTYETDDWTSFIPHFS